MFKSLIKILISMLLTYGVYISYSYAKYGKFTVAFMGGAFILGVNIIVNYYIKK